MPAAVVDRSTPPAAGKLRPFHFPPFLRRRLPNGLEVLAARQPGVPLISLELMLPAGGQNDPAGKIGLATLTASAIDEGTRRRGAMEIAAEVEQLGGYLATGADWDEGYLGAGLLSSRLREGIDLLAEVLGEATFPDQEIERLGKQRLGEILRRSQDPSTLADEMLYRVVYQGTAYANPLIGTAESVPALDRASLVDFYQRYYTLHGAAFIAVGDLDPEEILREAEAVFGQASAAAPPAPEIRPRALDGISVHVVDRPGATQTELRLGHPGVARRDPDYIPLLLLNSLLGGKFTSRINMNLRERHGYTYGASTRFISRLQPGPFLVDAAVSTESAGAAAREVLHELRRIREDLVEPEEIDETRSYILGVFPYTFQTISDFAKRLETLAIYGLPSDYYDTYQERLTALSREELREAARRHLDPEHIAVVAVGPADTLVPQLEGLGAVTVSSVSPAASAGE
ncbi:MAG TPA: pitrilysin family protein [Thermoanaerobaculia bacterium]|jgi:zinc protease|nr:pitrilysin family protein [Thermoanaerobaculia bacterium]